MVGKGLKMGCDLLIAQGHVLVRALRQFDGLPSGKEVLRAPGALQRLGDVVRIMLTMGVAQRGQGHGIGVRQR